MSFPFDFCGVCPAPFKAIFPSTWRKIQSWTHLCLLITLLVGLALAVLDVLAVYHWTEKKQGGCWHEKCFYCTGEILSLVFILPLTTYMIKLIGQHDERMVTVQHDLQQEKQLLTEAYGTLLSDMDKMLSKAAENSYGFAERSFEDKRRDFIKFLEHCEPRLAQISAGSKVDLDKFLSQFKSFLRGWLKVFKECSIDPVAHPLEIVSDEELEACRTLAETVELVAGRLRNHSVQFISTRKREDEELRKKYDKKRKGLQGLLNKPSDKGPPSQQLMTTIAPDDSQARMMFLVDEPDPESGGILCTWIQCGGGVGCHVCSGVSAFPKTTSCFCMKFSLLSQEHVVIIMALLIGMTALVLRACYDDRMFITTVTGVYDVCLLSLLIAFERVDYLLKLERQLAALEKEIDGVEKTKEQMNTFWEKVHDTTEIWLHRTVPRLELLKEIHGQLEDKPKNQVQALLEGVLPCLARLEDSIGAVDTWMGKGEHDAAAKKKIGQQLNELVGTPDLVVSFSKALTTGALTYQPPPSLKAPKAFDKFQSTGTGKSDLSSKVQALEVTSSKPVELELSSFQQSFASSSR